MASDASDISGFVSGTMEPARVIEDYIARTSSGANEPSLSDLFAARQRRRGSHHSISTERPAPAGVSDISGVGGSGGSSSGSSGSSSSTGGATEELRARSVPPVPITIAGAEARLREAVNVYIQTRNAAKAPYDPRVPRIQGMWIMSPSGDGRALLGNEAGAMLEVSSDIEIRETAADCPWPYWVYKNHVDREIAKGEECPIKGIPLSSCLIVSVSMNCGHMFDHAAIVAWASRKSELSCPVCRAPIAGLWHIRSAK